MYRILILVSAFLLTMSAMLFVQGSNIRNPVALARGPDGLTLDAVAQLSVPATTPVPKGPPIGTQALAAAAAATAGATTRATSVALPGPVTVTQNSATYYTVEPGDSLADIALKFYGSPDGFARIFEANQGGIASPDKILVGQKLLIPG